MNRVPQVDVHLPTGRGASQEDVAPRVRSYLGEVRDHLTELHGSGGSGVLVNETHSDLMDRLVRRLFELAEEIYFAGGGEETAGLCVVAAGGYARREMSVHSDVDILFLYRDVLHRELDFLIDALRATKPRRLPTVLTKEEVQQLIAQLTGVHRLKVQHFNGSGLRLMERMRLRVKDRTSVSARFWCEMPRGERTGRPSCSTA